MTAADAPELWMPPPPRVRTQRERHRLVGTGGVSLVLAAGASLWWLSRHAGVMVLVAGPRSAVVVTLVGWMAWLVVLWCAVAAPWWWPPGSQLAQARNLYWAYGVIVTSGGFLEWQLGVLLTEQLSPGLILVAVVMGPMTAWFGLRRPSLSTGGVIAARACLAVACVVAILNVLLISLQMFLLLFVLPLGPTYVEEGGATLVEEEQDGDPGYVNQDRWIREGVIYVRDSSTRVYRPFG